MDIGCYCISLARFIFGSEPHKVLGKLEYDPEFRTDRLCSGILDFGEGTSSFTCSHPADALSAGKHFWNGGQN